MFLKNFHCLVLHIVCSYSCVICIYVSSYTFVIHGVYHSSFLLLCFTLYFLVTISHVALFPANLDLFSGPVVFPVACILWYI
jgi:hypothetical protein